MTKFNLFDSKFTNKIRNWCHLTKKWGINYLFWEWMKFWCKTKVLTIRSKGDLLLMVWFKNQLFRELKMMMTNKLKRFNFIFVQQRTNIRWKRTQSKSDYAKLLLSSRCSKEPCHTYHCRLNEAVKGTKPNNI